MQNISRTNSDFISKPVGNYSHVTRVPKGAGLVVTSGQIGTDLDGNVPSGLNDQVSNTFANIQKILEAENLTEKNIIKVNIWATEQIDWEHLDAKWDELFTSAYPSMTIAYVSALGLPELKIELDVWAAG